MSQRAHGAGFKVEAGLLAAIALYAVWTLATWLLEGRVETLLRPDAVVDRAIYAVFANLLIGFVGAIVVLRYLFPAY